MNTTRTESFRQVLAAALGTRYYRALLEAASLGSLEQIRRLASIAVGLECLPPLDPGDYLSRPAWFQNSAVRRTTPLAWRFSQAPSARTAMLMEGLHGRGSARLFPDGLGRMLAWCGAEAIAGPLGRICKLGRALESGELRMRPLSRAVIVFVRPHEQPLSDDDREQLWRQFQVPIYEHLLGYAGELLAWECEAHEGLHVCSETAIFENRAAGQANLILATSLVNLAYPMLRLVMEREGWIIEGLCPCGQSGERLISPCVGTVRHRASRDSRLEREHAAAMLS